jgi:hypothetical protein
MVCTENLDWQECGEESVIIPFDKMSSFPVWAASNILGSSGLIQCMESC